MLSKIWGYKSKTYNWVFSRETGAFARWGLTKEDDPSYSPVGPEILDIEVSEVCSQGCSHCYKSNGPSGRNMSLNTFKTILDKMPKNLTQAAFGVGDIDANKDLFSMFSYCKDRGIVPNVTINGSRLTDRTVDQLVKHCGAVAVSNYDTDVCYNAVERLTNAGLKQVNIHQLLSAETFGKCFEVVCAKLGDKRLAKLGSIVFLTLKPKGRRNKFKSITKNEYTSLIRYIKHAKVDFGFDSCAANNFRSVEGNQKYEAFIEPCESCLFSSYVNVVGDFYPCSFAEGEKGFKGINVQKCSDFLEDVWFAKGTNIFRSLLLAKGRSCPIFQLEYQ